MDKDQSQLQAIATPTVNGTFVIVFDFLGASSPRVIGTDKLMTGCISFHVNEHNSTHALSGPTMTSSAQ